MADKDGAKILDVLLEAGKIDEEQYKFLVGEQKSTKKTFEQLISENKVVDCSVSSRN